MKRCPNYIKENIRKTNFYMQKIVELNIELENSIKKLGISNDPSDYLHNYQWWPGYEISSPESLIEDINDSLNY